MHSWLKSIPTISCVCPPIYTCTCRRVHVYTQASLLHLSHTIQAIMQDCQTCTRSNYVSKYRYHAEIHVYTQDTVTCTLLCEVMSWVILKEVGYCYIQCTCNRVMQHCDWVPPMILGAWSMAMTAVACYKFCCICTYTPAYIYMHKISCTCILTFFSR